MGAGTQKNGAPWVIWVSLKTQLNKTHFEPVWALPRPLAGLPRLKGYAHPLPRFEKKSPRVGFSEMFKPRLRPVETTPFRNPSGTAAAPDRGAGWRSLRPATPRLASQRTPMPRKPNLQPPSALEGSKAVTSGATRNSLSRVKGPKHGKDPLMAEVCGINHPTGAKCACPE